MRRKIERSRVKTKHYKRTAPWKRSAQQQALANFATSTANFLAIAWMAPLVEFQPPLDKANVNRAANDWIWQLGVFALVLAITD